MTAVLRAQAALLLIAIMTNATAADNPYYDPSKPHHTPEGFRNNYIAKVEKPMGHVLRWQWEAYRDGLPKPAQTPTPTVAPDLALIKGYKANAQPLVTWIGHATLLVQAGGLNVLTDPVFSERASPLQIMGPKRAQPPGVAMDDLPPIDVVVVSHNHYDHLDRSSVLLLAERGGGKTLFLVPLGLKPWMEKQGITNVVELDWWQHHDVNGVEFHLTPVQHWSARGLGDRSETLWGGWAVLSTDLHWYFGGDTAYSKDFIDTRAHFAPRQTAALGGGFDLALLPIGAYAPRWFMKEQHANPEEAVQIHLDLGAKRSIGMHWGTFSLTDEPLDQPPMDLIEARAKHQMDEATFSVLKIGETRRVEVRRP